MSMKLNPARLPAGLSVLIPLAQRWAFEDDGDRALAIKRASRGELEELAHCMEQLDTTELQAWLTGLESFRKRPSNEYIAITCLMMAMDHARLLLKRNPDRLYMKARPWQEISSEPMSKDSIAALYQPPGNFRISKYSYPAGTRFTGAMRSCICYVTTGRCRITIGESLWLNAGEFAALLEGDYEMEVPELSGRVTLIKVWDLAKLMNRQ